MNDYEIELLNQHLQHLNSHEPGSYRPADLPLNPQEQDDIREAFEILNCATAGATIHSPISRKDFRPS